MADYPTLIGRFIHHCGSIELLINNTIMALSNDKAKASKIVSPKIPLATRIDVLVKLLKNKKNLTESEIVDLAECLNHLRINRNKVAHNPIVSDSPTDDINMRIVQIEYFETKPSEIIETIEKEDMENLVTKSRELMMLFVKLIPESKSS